MGTSARSGRGCARHVSALARLAVHTRPARGTLRAMDIHPFDRAIALAPQPDGSALGATSPAYWNMIGPFGGITAAIAVNAVMQHPALLGEPLALTINYAAPIAAGAFRARARPARTNRSTRSEERRVGKECRSRWSPY